MKPKISLITLGVEDVKRSVAFYKKLGFKIASGDGEDMAMFKLEGTWLGIYPKDKLADDALAEMNDDQFSGITLAHNVTSKDEVNKVIAEFAATGATIQKPAQDTFWGGYSGYVADQDGYLWEICWNPFTDLT